MCVTTNILQRTFRIRKKKEGTCFTIDVQGKRYLITARHLVGPIPNVDIVKIFRNKKWQRLPVRLVGHGTEDIDVTVLAPQDSFGPSHPLRLTTASLALAEDVYFLGFPYGLSMEVKAELNAGFPLPLVKKAIVSAVEFEGKPMLLDGHNNPGFSGGPVVRRGNGKEQTVIGVVSGYRYETEKIREGKGKETPYTYDANTGIIRTHQIEHALEIIEKNPIGIPI